MMVRIGFAGVLAVAALVSVAHGAAGPAAQAPMREFRVPSGTHPHDVAPAPDGTVWYTAQFKGALGRLDPKTSRTHHIPLGAGAAPHGVITGSDGDAWVTDQGLNAVVRVDLETEAIRVFRVPTTENSEPYTAVFDRRGTLWFTGASGYYGRLDTKMGKFRVWRAPRGAGPYGITATPKGDVYFASLQKSYVGRIDIATGKVSALEPPTRGQGARRVWSDSRGRVWVSEWNAGKLARYDPAAKKWREWRLPGSSPQPYAIYVDRHDVVWLSDFGSNALVSFDPATQRFRSYPLPSSDAAVRQLLGRGNELWGAESAVDKLVVLRTR